MTNPRPEEVRLRDPLSEVTRNERRTLLGACAIGIVIVKTGLIPSKISALGIEFNQTDRRSLLLAIAAIVVYFLIAFLIYAASDFLAWRIAFQRTVFERMLERSKLAEDDDDREWQIRRETAERYKFRNEWYTISKPISLVRAIFEFIIPILIGIYAVFLLVRTPV